MTRTSGAIRSDIAKVSAETCHCVSCEMCDGTGSVKYGDSSEGSEPCEYCDRGIKQVCDRCTLLADLDYELEEK